MPPRRRSPDPDLKPMPSDMDLVAAVTAICTEKRQRGRVEDAAFANEVAFRCGHSQGAYRRGNGAVKGSWSGTMSPAPRFSTVLKRLARQDLIVESYDLETSRAVFYPKGWL